MNYTRCMELEREQARGTKQCIPKMRALALETRLMRANPCSKDYLGSLYHSHFLYLFNFVSRDLTPGVCPSD